MYKNNAMSVVADYTANAAVVSHASQIVRVQTWSSAETRQDECGARLCKEIRLVSAPNDNIVSSGSVTSAVDV